MGRRLFLQHLASASRCPPTNISNVQSLDDGVVAFTYSYPGVHNLAPKRCSIQLVAMNVDEYPDNNQYLVFTEDDTIDPVIAKSFELLSASQNGIPIAEALTNVSIALTDLLTQGLATNPIDLDAKDAEVETNFVDDFSDCEAADDESFGLIDLDNDLKREGQQAANKDEPISSHIHVPVEKIKGDLRATKNAGFRVGIIGDPVTCGIVTVSIRVTKLGLSEEAMHAWGLRKAHFLVLLIRFRKGYRSLQQVASEATLSDHTQIRVALCTSYKPSDLDAYQAFDKSNGSQPLAKSSLPPLEPLFIGTPLNYLFRERFSSIVKLRESRCPNWRSAEAMVHNMQGKIGAQEEIHPQGDELPDGGTDRALLPIVREDSLCDKSVKDASLPLVAMQFLLRHFVRCTEFCLVCHCETGATFEALKPYVCSKPLCLYQYMGLGLGPTIEWEVVSQPYVVDLLVSFCYAAAIEERLLEFPVGIGLKLPLLPCSVTWSDDTAIKPSFKAQLNFDSNNIVFDPQQKVEAKGFRVGDWLVACHKKARFDYHYRIEEIGLHNWQLSKPAITKTAIERPGFEFPVAACKGILPVDCYAYDCSFDDMTAEEKRLAIVMMLDTLPSVPDMKDYLEEIKQAAVKEDVSVSSKRSKRPISRPALNIFRWIIASNRSCIMQVGQLSDRTGKSGAACDPRKSSSSSSSTAGLVSSSSRVSGMDDWVQFRFAQGAPDKEQRFVNCVKKETPGAKHPTLFAWHGSPLENWHSIVRQGLQMKETLHGRTYGNGIYMSNYAMTSISYTNKTLRGRSKPLVSSKWPQSILCVTSALSLQEVVNKPERFVSRMPHYVVADPDWIQTRYLFIKSESKQHSTTEAGPSVAIYDQDPEHRCHNELCVPVQIPITAISKSRRPACGPTAVGRDDEYVITSEQHQDEDDLSSVMSDDDHSGLLEPEIGHDDDDDDKAAHKSFPPSLVSPSLSRKRKSESDDDTDFVPGVLDVSSIKFLDPPKDASTSATRALQRALQEVIKIQSNTPLSRLGWYINPNHVINLYQWIVELHSFNHELPLARDMKEAGITSIVLEMQFTNQFPFSPPFIRVVKPRFLPFSAGGGGHVTEGGAICMELLTNTGWMAATSIEMVLLQVQLAMSDQDRPARLVKGRANSISNLHGQRAWRGGYGHRGDSYGVGEAVAAYERACRAHGWKIPDGFANFARE